jgi:hypothetical protein
MKSRRRLERLSLSGDRDATQELSRHMDRTGERDWLSRYYDKMFRIAFERSARQILLNTLGGEDVTERQDGSGGNQGSC